jgi:peptidoglycan/LPS O-acetylase OafA/YrhL
MCILIGRPLIGIAVSWFIITNACGYNCKLLVNLAFCIIKKSLFPSHSRRVLFIGLTSKLFSARIFVRVNKLTYAIYLLNPLVISVVYGKFENGAFVDPMLYSILIIGISLLTYVLAIAFTLLFEIPFCRLSSEILRSSGGGGGSAPKVKTK